jgi:bifunctional N-acetylglucosamine-1-phosphate-uridyltransferase/glucosamine-1-phosphate-acetyltransferase GlmU-like protein
MLCAYMVIHAIDTAFQDAEETLYCVCGDQHTRVRADVLASRVIDLMVLATHQGTA